MVSDYKYAFAPIAVQDIDDTLDYISNTLLNPEAAESLYQKIFFTIEQNLKFPYGMSDCALYGISDPRYRHMIVNNYVLFLRIDDTTKTLWIVRFLYSARNIEPPMLKEDHNAP